MPLLKYGIFKGSEIDRRVLSNFFNFEYILKIHFILIKNTYCGSVTIGAKINISGTYA